MLPRGIPLGGSVGVRLGVTNSYSHKVRVGNWSEEQEMQEARMKDFIHRKEKGMLMVHKIQKNMQQALKEVPLSSSRDGLVRLGDSIMLWSSDSEGVLSCDPSDRAAVGGVESAVGVQRPFVVTTSTLVKAHVARNTFIIEPYGGDQGLTSDGEARIGSVLRLGQPFRLRAHPALLDASSPPFYLASQPLSAQAASKVSRKQIVYMSSTKGFDTVWKAAWKDIGRRFEMDGQPLPAHAEIVLLHVATNTALSSSAAHIQHTDFGQEFEVAAHTYLDVGKRQGLYAEMLGKQTTDIPYRREMKCNHFAMLMAPYTEEGEQKQEEELARTQVRGASGASSQEVSATAIQLVKQVRETLLSRGPDQLFAFYRAALQYSRNGSFGSSSGSQGGGIMVGYPDFLKLLLSHGCKVSTEEFEMLVHALDRDLNQGIDVTRFVQEMRGPLANARSNAIASAWLLLDPFGSGSVSVSQALQQYVASHDPEVRTGRVTASQALESMRTKLTQLSYQDAATNTTRVTRREFEALYAMLSAFVANEEYFVQLVKGLWRQKTKQ